ncbi:MAG: cytochrome b/b6 domain-containing protein [Pseudomonadota bacterium]
MAAANTHASYGSVAKSFHWLTALLILSLIPMGWIANEMPYDTAEQLAQKAFLFSMHKTFGVLVFFVALARIVWAIVQPKPGALNADAKLEHWAAETVHYLLYGSLVLVPLTGWIHHAATTGFAPIQWPFGQSLPLVPKSETVADVFAGLHIVFIRVMILSMLLHILGAFKHLIIDRDQTLQRMWFGKNRAPSPGAHTSQAAPIVSALSAWVVALGIGAGTGIYANHSGAPVKAEELVAVASDWVVQDGSINIETQQFGNKVNGTFADWTAAIQFDPDVVQGKAGEVDVTISIPSLTLGSVTEQALGADYFDAEAHATAVYKADIVTIPDGYAAQGDLTLRGVSLPVEFPFDLRVDEDGTATMNGTLTLNRMDYSIGQNMADESSLGFSVAVILRVVARQAE